MQRPKYSLSVPAVFKALSGAIVLCLSQAASALDPAAIPVATHDNIFLLAGNPTDGYFVDNSRWGAGSLTEGGGPNQYEQVVGVDPDVGAGGEVAFRMKWRWPAGTTEVKGFPTIISGKRAGHSRGGMALLPNGSTRGPLSETPGSVFPLQLPVKSLKSKFAIKNLSAPTGQGHLSYDIWLQSAPGQDASRASSSITHEIMIPLQNWGNYGGHNNLPNSRNHAWYDHDVTIGGRLYHVYAYKGTDGAVLYNFGQGMLDGTYGKTGWKFITFVPDVFPVPAGELDLAAFINHVATRKDSKGNPWALGNEYVSSVELGIEPVVGTGDIAVYDYKVSTAGSASAAVSAPAAEPLAACGGSNWIQGKQYAAGSVVSYAGKQYIAKFANPGYTPTISTYYWSTYSCAASSVPAPVPVAACSGPIWVQGRQYAAGNVVSYGGSQYVAKFANPGYTPTISTYYWAPSSC